ncbi:MAG: hypothetical protein KC503_04300 [Myxococcales bacterium]|nr:hypothetical protein [Myxococcales bacterium]
MTAATYAARIALVLGLVSTVVIACGGEGVDEAPVCTTRDGKQTCSRQISAVFLNQPSCALSPTGGQVDDGIMCATFRSLAAGAGCAMLTCTTTYGVDSSGLKKSLSQVCCSCGGYRMCVTNPNLPPSSLQ